MAEERRGCGDRRFRRRLGLPALAVFAAGLGAAPTHGQAPEPFDVRAEVFAGEELEEYLRVMQGSEATNWYPWSVRAFSPGEVERMVPEDAAHPWSERFRFSGGQFEERGGIRAGWVAPRAQAFFNSAYPYGRNDGAVWAGKGLTTALRGGAWARVGPLSLVLAPTVFRAENGEFALAPAAGAATSPYGDGRNGGDRIDLPQRFGDGAYARVSPGQSTLRLDAGPLAVAVSSANQYWGPAAHNPLLLGNNAEGFPHVFLGSSRPWNVGIGLIHGRMVWGRLEQSEYAPVADPDELRFMSGMTGVFRPRGLPGLELGAARFFHSPWPESGFELADFAKPLEGFLKVSLTGDEGREGNSDNDNQLASVFLRWAPPATGFEVYGEYAREDHSWNLRDFILEPDHDSAYLLGFRRVWGENPVRWTVLRGELMNAEVSHLFRVRPQYPFYVHVPLRQGHTHLGQVLGSAWGYGGAATELAVDRYHSRGRWTFGWSRAVHDRRGRYWEEGTVERDAADTSHTLSAETLYFLGNLEATASLGTTYRFNRHFGDDVVNVGASLGVVWRP